MLWANTTFSVGKVDFPSIAGSCILIRASAVADGNITSDLFDFGTI